jgi:hypothetical protein
MLTYYKKEGILGITNIVVKPTNKIERNSIKKNSIAESLNNYYLNVIIMSNGNINTNQLPPPVSLAQS